MSKVKVSKENILNLYGLLMSVDGKKDKKFQFAALRNTRKLKPEIDVIQEMTKPSEEFIKFDTARVELLRSCALMKDGQLQMHPGTSNAIIDPAKMDEFKTKFEEMRLKYSETIKDREETLKEVQEFLKSEIEVEIHQVSYDEIPNEISREELLVLEPMILPETVPE